MNHSEEATCWWHVCGDLLSGSGCVELRCGLWAFPSAGQELCIRYQDHAGNTSLLLRYGFIEGRNQDDRVRIDIPWEPSVSERQKSKKIENLSVCAHLATLCAA